WALVITSAASFMVALDTLVVATALPRIRTDLGASLGQLEWTVNAYTLSFAGFLMAAAAIGDRLGRRRMFAFGLGLFTAASAACAPARLCSPGSPRASVRRSPSTASALHSPPQRAWPWSGDWSARTAWAGRVPR